MSTQRQRVARRVARILAQAWPSVRAFFFFEATVHDAYTYRYRHVGYRRKLSQPFDAKAPKKKKNYIKTLGTYADLSIPPAAATTAGSSSPPSPGQTKLHCLKVLRKAAQDTRRHRRVESITGSPSAGDHPQTSSTMDPGSLSTNNAAAGKIEPAPLSHLPQDPKLPSHPQKKRPTYLSAFQANGLPTVYSRTELPRRETNLHGFAVSAGAEHQRGEEESEKTYSATTPPPSPRRCRLET